MLKAGDEPDHRVLNVAGQTGREAVDVDLAGVPPFRFQEQLVPRAVGKADDFGLKRGAVAGPHRFDLAGVHRRPVQVRLHQLVDGRIGVGDPAGKLVLLDPVGQKRKGLGIVVARLDLQSCVVQRATVEAGRRAGLEAGQTQADALKRLADARRGPFAGSAAGRLLFATVKYPLHERAGTEDDRPGTVFGVAVYANAGDPRASLGALDQEVLDQLLSQVEVWLLLDEPLDLLLIGSLVGLGSRAVHGGALPLVEQAELKARAVDGQAHRSAEGVDFADDLPLGNPADGRIAAHLGDRIQVARQQGRAGSHPRSGQGRFGTGMAGADHQDVVVVAAGGHIRMIRCPPRPGKWLWSDAVAAGWLGHRSALPQPPCRPQG